MGPATHSRRSFNGGMDLDRLSPPGIPGLSGATTGAARSRDGNTRRRLPARGPPRTGSGSSTRAYESSSWSFHGRVFQRLDESKIGNSRRVSPGNRFPRSWCRAPRARSGSLGPADRDQRTDVHEQPRAAGRGGMTVVGRTPAAGGFPNQQLGKPITGVASSSWATRWPLPAPPPCARALEPLLVRESTLKHARHASQGSSRDPSDRGGFVGFGDGPDRPGIRTNDRSLDSAFPRPLADNEPAIAIRSLPGRTVA